MLGALSIALNKKARVGALLVGLMFLLFALLVHLPGMGADDAMTAMMSQVSFMKDTMLSGAAWTFAGLAKD